ncbi:YihY/virulence factor BrkB family protein [Stakelama saccharophila]|uniref:YihY/virulence factor BrkB family protein n=1 Tax=Stakelama saccharophila TaxID=3075605 RepID=A0ABZ0B699_9SPHN|nr:YihY/virulence factor BrkB family protein [Stakelama sp. W311]WNO52926.1 YihY/virulence factor BrkB family protein [Stakelama sp. W311]
MSEQRGEVDTNRIPGFDSGHPWQHPWPAWKAIFGRIYSMTGYHNLSLMAAGVAFYAFLSFVPLLGAVVMTYGLVADPGTVAEHMQTVIRLVPTDAASLIRDQLESVANTAASQAGIGLAIALFFSVYGAMRAANAMIQALNVVYEEDESRNMIQTTILAIFLTLGAIVAVLVGVVAAIVLGFLQEAVGMLGEAGVVLIKIATWLVAAAIVSAGFAFIFRYGPDRARARWRWLSVGSVASTLLWLVATLLFGIYTANFANYNATYGALGAVVVLLMWLFVSSYAVLLGAEINAEAERQTGVDSTTGMPRPFGERGATVADTLPSKRQIKPKRAKY